MTLKDQVAEFKRRRDPFQVDYSSLPDNRKPRKKRIRSDNARPDPSRMLPLTGREIPPMDTSRHDPASQHYWGESILHIHLQDKRITDEEHRILAGIGVKLFGWRAL